MKISPNQNIEIIISTNSGSQSYPSRVEDVDEGRMLIAAPLERGYTLPIRPNTPIVIDYRDKNPKNQGRYQAPALVERRVSSKTLPLLLISLTGDWAKIQERDFVRVEVLLNGTYAVLIDDQHITNKPCLIRDLGGGGLLLATSEALKKSAKIVISIPLDNNQVEVVGSIVRIHPMDGMNEYGISFTDIEERIRQEIIQFVFRRQVEMRRKGVY